MNGFLKKKFDISEIKHLDNSPNIVIGKGNINRKAKTEYFILECESEEEFVFIDIFEDDKDVSGEYRIIRRFYIQEGNKNELIKFQAFEAIENNKSLIIEINDSSVILNIDSNFLRHEIDLENVAEPPDHWSGFEEIKNVYIDTSRLKVSKQLPKSGTLAEFVLSNEGSTESAIINDVLNLLFIKWVTEKKRSPYDMDLDWIGPNRLVTEKSYVIDGKNDFIENSFLNKVAIDSMNHWLERNEYINLDYKFVFNEPNLAEGDIQSIDIKEFGVKKRDEDGFLKLTEVGSGIGHIFQILLPFFNGTEFLIIQQPEIHLHPSLQVQLARALFSLANEKRVQIILETHSEHFIKAAQLEIARSSNQKLSSISKDDLSVLYVAKDESGFSKVRQIQLDETGAFTEPWPDDFFELSADLSLERLRQSYKSRN